MNDLNIIKNNEDGFGILIERDAGYITREINNKNKILTESFEYNPEEPILINCVLQKYGVPNRNGRIYPEKVLKKQVDLYNELVLNNSAISESDHPESTNISLLNVSHLITKMWWGTNPDDKHVLYGQLRIVVSPGFLKYGIPTMIGDKIIVYLQHGIRIGISSRGVGSLSEEKGVFYVQDDFELVGFDLVATPSTFGAYLFPNKNQIQMKENIIKNDTKIIKENKKINAINNFLL